MAMMTRIVMTIMIKRMKMMMRRTAFDFTTVLIDASRPQETVNLINVVKRPKTAVTHVNPG